MNMLRLAAATMALLFSGSQAAQAKIVSYDYSGVIEDTQPNAIFANGTSFFGTISYDSDFLPSATSATTATYTAIPGLFSINIGGFSASLNSFNAFVRDDDGGPDDDMYVFSSPLPGVDGNSSPYSWNLLFADSSKTQVTSTGLPEAIPALGSHYTSFNISGGKEQSASFGSTSLAVSAVPEPATWLLMIAGFGAAGAMLRRRRRFTDLNVAYA
ncbi:PEPxxWA-CTERM sorting domain-containing protein [Sphingobium phenoxybenzoativorans]|uniref:PEPxxWA-CTERM sorting domain-containing protein n=1 Tax=Sphingobium phenoxybenzoativorans TaxID=1592790 RepID=UPI0009F644DD|nr:PEPxxWA-CTERM sorting domain-containing protein [Sphingobium phenoxybenzoativorans]